MRSLAIALVISASVSAETVVVEFMVDDETPAKHRVVYDTNMSPTIDNQGDPTTWSFRLWESRGYRLSSNQWVDTDDAMTRMWFSTRGKWTIVDFLEGGFAGDHSFFKFDRAMDMPPSERELLTATPISRCDALTFMDSTLGPSHPDKGFWPPRACPSDPVQTEVSWMNLKNAFGLFQPGDSDRDFDVDFQDYILLANNYSPGSVQSADVLPEPSSAFLATLSAIGALCLATRKSSMSGCPSN